MWRKVEWEGEGGVGGREWSECSLGASKCKTVMQATWLIVALGCLTAA